jgi:hypothetical protein
MKSIAQQGPWSYFHVSAWSDLDQALATFPDTKLLVCLHPYREVLGCGLDVTKRRVKEIVGRCRGRDYVVCLTELMSVNGPAEDLRRLKDACAVCEDALAGG